MTLVMLFAVRACERWINLTVVQELQSFCFLIPRMVIPIFHHVIPIHYLFLQMGRKSSRNHLRQLEIQT